jgi:hypothetical protein
MATSAFNEAFIVSLSPFCFFSTIEVMNQIEVLCNKNLIKCCGRVERRETPSSIRLLTEVHRENMISVLFEAGRGGKRHVCLRADFLITSVHKNLFNKKKEK